MFCFLSCKHKYLQSMFDDPFLVCMFFLENMGLLSIFRFLYPSRASGQFFFFFCQHPAAVWMDSLRFPKFSNIIKIQNNEVIREPIVWQLINYLTYCLLTESEVQQSSSLISCLY